MKTMKRITSLLLALLMTFAMSTTAFAAKITVNGIAGKTYTAYKIFDVIWQDKNHDEAQNDGDSYGYSISKNSEWYDLVNAYAAKENSKLTLTASGTADTYTVAVEEGFAAADFAADLRGERDKNLAGKKAAATGTIANGATTTELTVEKPGYYLVTTDAGSLCILKTAASDVTVNEKNSEIPDVVKQVKEDDAKDPKVEFGESNTVQIGQEIEFKATITVKYNPKNYVLHDKMDNGLTFKEVSSVKVENADVDKANYKVITDDLKDNGTFEISFNDDYLKKLPTGTKIVVTYTAFLNENAVIAGAGNVNTAKLEYQNKDQFTEEDTTTTYTYEFDLVKTDDEGKLLSDAEFKLYEQESGGTPIEFVKVTEAAGTTYRVALSTDEPTIDTIVIPEGGTVKISGLDAQKYYLEETKAPAGYNPLSERKEVDLSDGNLNLIENALKDEKYDNGDGGVQVENKTGSMLPETGAAGTVMFAAIGTVVVLGAGVLLVTKKRMNMIR